MDEPRSLKLSDAVRINPPISLDRGTNYPFVEMAALEPGEKYVGRSQIRPFSGGGARFEDGDTLMARITPCLENGKLAVYTADGNCRQAHGSTEFIVFRERAGVTRPDFIYYLITSPAVREYAISQMAGTSGRQRVLISAFDHFKIRLPSLKLQKAIATLLGALDNKIELNRRMNETLEAMARAIFKDWFVDFGPTRAKAEGRPPYLSPEIWDLFPDAFDDKDKPVGWETRSLKDFIEIVGGGTPKTSVPEYWGGGTPWFSVVDTPPKGSIFVVETEKNITERGLAESSARLIPAGTTIISARGAVGHLAMAATEMTFNQSCYALRRTDQTGDCFVYLAAQHMVAQLQAMAHGSVFSTITRQTFEVVSLAMPSTNALTAFEEQVAPLFQRIRANVFESQTLTQTRDLLLSKLMSGEIRLREAEKAVEAAE